VIGNKQVKIVLKTAISFLNSYSKTQWYYSKQKNSGVLMVVQALFWNIAQYGKQFSQDEDSLLGFRSL